MEKIEINHSHEDELKTCTKCGKEKHISQFYADKQKTSGKRPDCKECNIKKCTEWARNNKERRKSYVTKSATGVDSIDFNNLLNLQEDKCGICGKSTKDNKRRLSIDHCHKSKIVRGLLCTRCNFGLGYFQDNEELLSKAIEYLKDNYSKLKIKYK